MQALPSPAYTLMLFLSCACQLLHRHKHTFTHCLPAFPWFPWWRTGEFKDRYVFKWDFASIICPLMHYEPWFSKAGWVCLKVSEIWKCTIQRTWHMLVFVCWPAASSVHLQSMLCLRVWITCLAASTYKNRHKHRHAPIWSLIRRADCPT